MPPRSEAAASANTAPVPSEDLGTLEKFRPYGVPTDAWLEIVARAIVAR